MVFPNYWEVPGLMKKYMNWINAYNNGPNHPLIFAAQLHSTLLQIHPFSDGNGRLSRIIFQIALNHYGFPPLIIPKESRRCYFECLREVDKNNYKPYLEFIFEEARKSLLSIYDFPTKSLTTLY